MSYKLFLPGVPYMENEDFVIHCPASLHDYLEEVMFYNIEQKKKILDFFGLENFRKVQINLYDNHDDFKEFSKQFFEPASYTCGHFSEGMVNCYISEECLKDKKLLQQRIRSVGHEFVHLVYDEAVQEKGKERIRWLDEGLAIYLSDQRSGLEDELKFKNYFLRDIVRRDKIVPNISFLKQSGDKYGTFCDTETNKYDGYDLSYLMVRFLMETLTKDQFQVLIRNTTSIEEIESSILNDAINFYSKMFEVKDNFSELETEQELLDYMNKNVLYGWKDYNGELHCDTMKGFRNLYRTGSLVETINNNIGTCIEQVMLEKAFFDKIGVLSKMYALRSYGLEEQNDDEVKMHCFLLFEKNNKVYHLEHANPLIPGIYEYENEDIALKNICEYYQKRDNGKSRRLNEFDEVPPDLSFKEFNEYLNQLDANKTKAL